MTNTKASAAVDAATVDAVAGDNSYYNPCRCFQMVVGDNFVVVVVVVPGNNNHYCYNSFVGVVAATVAVDDNDDRQPDSKTWL